MIVFSALGDRGSSYYNGENNYHDNRNMTVNSDISGIAGLDMLKKDS